MTWPTKKIGEVCELQRGNEPGSRTYNTKGKGIRFIRVADISKQRTSPIWTTGKNLVICKKEDILMAFDGSPGVVFRGILGAISSGIRIIKPKNNKELLDDFLFYILQTESVQNTVKKYTIGVSIWHASKSIPHIEIPLPPLKIQKQIVARIEELFEKIDKAKELRQKVQEETEQIFQSALYQVFDKAEKKWRKKKIAEITKLVTKGTTPTTYGYKFTTSGTPFLRVEDIGNKELNYKSTKLFVDRETNQFLSRSQTQIGDVLVTIAGTIGRSAYIPEGTPQMNMNQAIALVRLDKKIAFPRYIYLTLQSDNLQKQMYGGQVTATITNLSLTRIRNLQIPLPSLPEQKKIVAYLDGLQEKVGKLKKFQEKQLKDLEELKKSILEKAFSGELVK